MLGSKGAPVCSSSPLAVGNHVEGGAGLLIAGLSSSTMAGAALKRSWVGSSLAVPTRAKIGRGSRACHTDAAPGRRLRFAPARPAALAVR
jgi:hypothetical protein